VQLLCNFSVHQFIQLTCQEPCQKHVFALRSSVNCSALRCWGYERTSSSLQVQFGGMLLSRIQACKASCQATLLLSMTSWTVTVLNQVGC
jgi:hypothetical protein